MGNYRRRIDIIADILNVACRNPKKTQIMFQANLSFRVLQKYLAELSGASLICFKDETQCYVLTAKGQQFLEAYKEYLKTSRHVEKVLNDVNVKKAILEKMFNQ